MLIAKLLHLLAAVIWVGGMFFAYQILRPAAGALGGPERLGLWRRVFAGFFPWVWAAVVLLPVTGLWMILGELGGFAAQPWPIHVMFALGIVMIGIFHGLVMGPYRRFSVAVDAADFTTAGTLLPRIRRLVGINLILGLLTVALAATARHW